MKQIIELAQQLLAAEQQILQELKNEKENTLNEALRLQSEIPVREAKVEALNDDLQDLYERYGYPGLDSEKNTTVSESVSPAPKIGKSSFSSKKPAVNKNDILRAVNELSFSDYAEALRLINNLNDDL